MRARFWKIFPNYFLQYVEESPRRSTARVPIRRCASSALFFFISSHSYRTQVTAFPRVESINRLLKLSRLTPISSLGKTRKRSPAAITIDKTILRYDTLPCIKCTWNVSRSRRSLIALFRFRAVLAISVKSKSTSEISRCLSCLVPFIARVEGPNLKTALIYSPQSPAFSRSFRDSE